MQANFQSSRQLTPSQSLASNAANDNSVYSLHSGQLTVSYAPDVFGGVRRQIEAADAQVDNQIFQKEATELTLTANLANALVQQASFEDQIEVTRRLIEIQDQLLALLKRQQQAGQIALPDVLAQETAVAQAKLLLPPLVRQREQQRHLVAVLAGRFPSELRRRTLKLASFKTPHKVPLSMPADLVRQRPDIKAAEANLWQANAQLGVAIANRFPQVAITGNAGSTALTLGQLFSSGTWFYMIAGGVTQTIFDGRTLEMKRKAAEETVAQQTAQYRSTVLTAFQNVADVLVALDADITSIAAARDAERAANRNLDLLRSQLEQGQVSLPSLLTAQQAFFQTSIARVQAEASRLQDTIALFQALGGGWWNRRETVLVPVGVAAVPVHEVAAKAEERK